jgi:hypothetical protein
MSLEAGSADAGSAIADLNSYVDENPIPQNVDEICSLFGISASLIHVALLTKSKITMIKCPTQRIEKDEAIIGRRFLRLDDFRRLASQLSFEMPTDVSQLITGNIIPTIWVSSNKILIGLDKFSEIFDNFDESSHAIIQSVILKLSFENKPITSEKIAFEALMLRCNGYPAICPKNAYIMRPPPSSFGWNAIASPIPSPSPSSFILSQPPSQSPMLKVTPAKEEEEEEEEEEEDDDEGSDDQGEIPKNLHEEQPFTDVVPKRRPKPKGPEYFGVASAPFSAPQGATYNRQQGEGIKPFNMYLEDGVKKKIPVPNILIEYTKQVQRVHKILQGVHTSNEKFREFMKAKTGPLFDLWISLHP